VDEGIGAGASIDELTDRLRQLLGRPIVMLTSAPDHHAGMFMMVANNGQNQAQRLQWLADILAGNRMLLHDFPFFRPQVAAFFQDLIGHGNLAEVVQESAASQGDSAVILKVEVSPHLGSIERQAFAMAFGIRVAGLDTQAERADHRLRGFQFVGKFLQLEKGTHARE